MRRIGSAVALVTIDIAGLVLGLYAALAFRSLLFDPKPILWGLLWDHETDWLAFLILLLVLVFWQARLYAPREVREGAGRVVPSVFLVAALALAFAIGTGQHFTTFGLYLVAATLVSLFIALFRSSYELATGIAAPGVRSDAGAPRSSATPELAATSPRHSGREPGRHRLRVRRRSLDPGLRSRNCSRPPSCTN